MSYCAIEEAFTPLVPGGPSTKKSKKSRTFVVPAAPAGSDQETKEYSLTSADDGRDPSGSRDADRPAQRPAPANDILSSPSGNGRLDAMTSSSDFFPMQGNNAEPEAWQKAFLLGDMSSSVQKPNFQVDQKPTLWRSIQKPVAEVVATTTSFVDSLAPIPDEIGRRLDSLSRQLESLTSVSPMQNTAELFLFVAIGLLLLLAIDTLLRYATAAPSSPLQVMSGGYTGGYTGGGYRYGGRGVGRRYK